MMDWKKFQGFVGAIQADLMPGFHQVDIEFEDDRRGIRRQLDAVYENREGAYKIRLLVEATTSGQKVGIRQMDAFIKKARSLACDKMIVVSRTGFTAAAIEAARMDGVETWVLRSIRDDDLKGTIGKVFGTLRMSMATIKETNITFREGLPVGFPASLTERDRDAVTIFDAQGRPKGNIWDFVTENANTPGLHVMAMEPGDHVYYAGQKNEIGSVRMEVEEGTLDSPWEVDLDASLLAAYENAQRSTEVRFIRRNLALPEGLQTLRREDFE